MNKRETRCNIGMHELYGMVAFLQRTDIIKKTARESVVQVNDKWKMDGLGDSA